MQAITNVGGCNHTYAYFITEILPQEVGVGSSVAKQQESIVVFIKDTVMYNNKRLEEYHSLETMVRLASSSNGFGCLLQSTHPLTMIQPSSHNFELGDTNDYRRDTRQMVILLLNHLISILVHTGWRSI